MTDRTVEASPRFKARISGLLYLIVILGAIFAEIFVRGRLVVHGDATATAIQKNSVKEKFEAVDPAAPRSTYK